MVGTRRRAATAATSLALLQAVVADDLDGVQRKLARPEEQQWSSEGGVNALHLAAGFAGSSVLAALLAAAGGERLSALINSGLAADYTDPNVLHPLLAKACDKTRWAFWGGATPLQIAVYFGDKEAVELLLGAGACPNTADHAGLTAMHVCKCIKLPSSSPHLHSTQGHRAKQHPDIPAMLLAAGGDIFTDTRGEHGRSCEAPLLYGLHSPHRWQSSRSAIAAFLQHAAEQAAAGKWAGAAWGMGQLVEAAVSVHCQSFFEQFWERMPYYSPEHKLSTVVSMGHVAAARQLLDGGTSASPALLPLAVKSCKVEMVQLLLQHGAAVSMAAVQQALGGMPQPAALGALLAEQAPAVEEMAYVSYWTSQWTCPILFLLSLSARRDWGASPAGDVQYRKAAADCMELLASAGYKPHVYTRMRHYGVEISNFDPLEELPNHFKIHGTNSWLWAAYQRPKWEPSAAVHARFPPAFRQAARCLLLAAHRSAAQAGRGGSGGLGRLPPELLLQIVGAAASPHSAWM